MGRARVTAALGLDPHELARLARASDRMLAGKPLLPHGQRPRRERPGRGLEFLEHRAYGPGDDPRDLDWRATARSRQPLVRRRREEGYSTAILCLDRSASLSPLSGARDSWSQLQRLAAALAYLLVHNGHRVGLLAFSESVDRALPPARGHAAWARIVHVVSELAPRRAGGASRLSSCEAHVPPGACPIVLSDFLAPGHMARELETLQRRGGRVQCVQIVDSELPGGVAPGPVALADVESGETRSLQLSPETLAAVARALEAHCEGLRRHCLRRGIPLTRCDGRSAWSDVILQHLSALSAAVGRRPDVPVAGSGRDDPAATPAVRSA